MRRTAADHGLKVPERPVSQAEAMEIVVERRWSGSFARWGNQQPGVAFPHVIALLERPAAD